MKNFFFLALIFLLFVACDNTQLNEELLFSETNLPTTSFTFLNDKDTILVGQKGLELHFPARIFRDKDGLPYTDSIQIELVEALELKDMILGNLATISNEGDILESSGMFQIKINGKKDKKELFLNPILTARIVLPHQEKEGSILFYGTNEKDGRMTWTASHLMGGDSSIYWLARGKQLLFKECASCHNTNLVDDMTGPALAWVSKRWESMEDLVLFTKNSIAFAELGNLHARYMINWSASAMVSYNHLSDQEIQAIYDYIDEQCRFRGIDSSIYDIPVSDSVYLTYFRAKDSIQTIQDSILGIARPRYNINVRGFYFSGNWINIDRYLIVDDASLIDFSVKIENEKLLGQTTLKLIIPKRDIVLNAYYSSDSNHYTFIENNTQIGLPIGEKAFLLATVFENSIPYYALTSFVIGEKKIENLTLEKSTSKEIMALINKTF